jgi:hypothetical protein
VAPVAVSSPLVLALHGAFGALGLAGGGGSGGVGGCGGGGSAAGVRWGLSWGTGAGYHHALKGRQLQE